jgi:hypothetical protein
VKRYPSILTALQYPPQFLRQAIRPDLAGCT